MSLAEKASPDLEYALVDALRPSSELDEARRRVKRNVQEIEAQLRLAGRRGEACSSEAILTEMTGRLQSMAAYQRTICRSGQFDEVDLAICLRQSANFLSRPHGRTPEPEDGSEGGWAFGSGGDTLSWTRGSRGGAEGRDPIGLSLGDAIRFLAPRWQEPARRAVCACAVMFPPGPFSWRSWFMSDETDVTTRPGDLAIRLNHGPDSLVVQLWVADRSLGLPRCFDREGKLALGQQIAARLRGQTLDALADPSGAPSFEVAFVSMPPSPEAEPALPRLRLLRQNETSQP